MLSWSITETSLTILLPLQESDNFPCVTTACVYRLLKHSMKAQEAVFALTSSLWNKSERLF